MSDQPLFALNMMIMVFDTYYLIRDDYANNSRDLMEFIKSDPTWVHDDTLAGWKCPRTVLPL